MIKIQLFILSVILGSNLIAQNANLDYRNALKVYNHFSYSNTTDESASNVSYSHKSFSFFNPTIAYQWKTAKGNLHEISLSDLYINHSEDEREYNDPILQQNVVDRGQSTTSRIALGYEYIVNFAKNSDWKLIPSVGFMTESSFTQGKYESMSSTDYTSSRATFGLGVFMVPRATWYMNDRFFLDLNLPVKIFSSSFTRNKIDLPTLNTEDRISNESNYTFFPSLFAMRIGIGIKL